MDPATNAPKCIVGPNGSTLCPSVVSVDADGSVIVGEPARRRLLTQSERTIYSVKRLMGRGVADIQDELKLFPFRIDPSSKNVIRVRLGDKTFTPPEISAFILARTQKLGRSTLWRNGRPRGYHRARIFQRRAAPSHKRRRPTRRTRSSASRQRTDRGRARLRPARKAARPRRRLRSRRRHVRHFHSQAHLHQRRRHLSGPFDQRRHAPRRRRHRQRSAIVDPRENPRASSASMFPRSRNSRRNFAKR